MKKKVRLLLQKLGLEENKNYRNFIHLRETGDISFEETVNILSKMFAEKSLLFHTRYKCLKYS